MAKLTFYYGTMSSGKTIDLIQTAYKYNSKGMKTIILKPKIDTKGDNKIVSRIGLSREVDIILGSDESIFDYKDKLTDITSLLVDEAQFLSEVQIKELFYLAKIMDINVICYGLRNDFKGNLFKGSAMLFCLADNFEKLKSVCATYGCGNNATYNARKINGNYVLEGPQVLIGVDDEYDPLCTSCYIKKVLEPNSQEFQKVLKKINSIKGDKK